VAPQGVERKLTTILCADVAGFSRLMGEDEEETLARLKTFRAAIGDLIAVHRGRVFGGAGDSLIAEFPSAVEAVRCAVGIQQDIEARNAAVAEDHRMRFRIGINLGDVMIEGDDLLGDGVNVAARLEGLAEPGGIDISGTVYDQVRHKVGLGYEYLGEQTVKNIADPLRVYRVRPEAAAAGSVAAPGPTDPRRALRWAAAAVIASVIAGAVLWSLYSRRPAPPVDTAAGPALDVPVATGPSIAVLPFTNMSADIEQDYFADGMTEDLITDLSKNPELFVIARNAVLTYKGRAVNAQRVGEDLGVRYVLEGSVRRAGNQVRINAQLTDASTGGLLWADRYDGALTDVFALQDGITRKIVAALAVNLPVAAPSPLAAGETDIAEAYDAFLQGWAHYRRDTPQDLVKAALHLENAVTLDPDYGRAHAALAAVYWESWRRGWAVSLGTSREAALDRAKHALQAALQVPTPLAHQVASQMLSQDGRHEEAIAEAERAIALDAGDPAGYQAMANAQKAAGRPPTGAYP
jgi:TolB-like protein/class 3 adenylate cyclase